MDSGRRARERRTSHPDRSKRNRKREEKEETAGAGGGRVGHGGKGLRGGLVGGGLFRPAWLCPAWLGRYISICLQGGSYRGKRGRSAAAELNTNSIGPQMLVCSAG